MIEKQDFSNIWFPRLHGSDKSYDNPDKALVYGLTFACEKVFEKSHDAIADLDNSYYENKSGKSLNAYVNIFMPNLQMRKPNRGYGN